MTKFVEGQEVVTSKSVKHIRHDGNFVLYEGTTLIVQKWDEHQQHYLCKLKHPETVREADVAFFIAPNSIRPVDSEPIEEDTRTREELLEDIQEISEIIGSFYTEGQEGAKSLSPQLFSHAPQIALVNMLANGMSRKKAKRLQDKINGRFE